MVAVTGNVQEGSLRGNLSPHLTAYEVLYLRRVAGLAARIPGQGVATATSGLASEKN
jgi:hypothetical protein